MKEGTKLPTPVPNREKKGKLSMQRYTLKGQPPCRLQATEDQQQGFPHRDRAMVQQAPQPAGRQERLTTAMQRAAPSRARQQVLTADHQVQCTTAIQAAAARKVSRQVQPADRQQRLTRTGLTVLQTTRVQELCAGPQRQPEMKDPARIHLQARITVT